jgi:hypothetical protein
VMRSWFSRFCSTFQPWSTGWSQGCLRGGEP